MAMKLIVPNIRIAAKIIKKILKRTRMGFLSFVLLFIFRNDHLLETNPLTPALSPPVGERGRVRGLNLVKLFTIKRLIKKYHQPTILSR
jgi:hypothetical protein